MSESILKALMQLFAIIAHPEDDSDKVEIEVKFDRRTVVESFLRQQLNQDLVREYLKVFDHYYELYQEKQSEKSKSQKRTSSSSVRVLKICTQINEELTQQQKVVVVIRLLEFAKSENDEITEQEMAFISTVAETFYVDDNEFLQIHQFVVNNFYSQPQSDRTLVINDNPNFDKAQKHIYAQSIQGEIRIFWVEFVNIYILRYTGNEELYLNGHLLNKGKTFILNNGASIRSPKIRPIYYSDIVARFSLDKIKEPIDFNVANLEYQFRGGKVGLHQMNLNFESGHLVGIMGASGSGKSTLLNVLSGSETPFNGTVKVNGIDIHNQAELAEGVIGLVSQDDLLIEELTVFQNLYYNAKLCFDNYSEEEIVNAVNETLTNLGLYEIKDMVVGSPLNKKISGGQRKRLNIALELIREPSVLFLDEPTSGLSSRDSENILDLLKELTLKGKLVFVVIHQPSSDIFKMFDKLVILDTGGYLIYNGDPIESIIYFKSKVQHANWNESECTSCGNVNPEQVFNILEANVLDEYGNPTRSRKTSPEEWYDFYNQSVKGEQTLSGASPRDLPKNLFKIPGWFKQLKVFVERDVLSKIANTQYMIINILEAPILAFLLAFIIKYYNVDPANQFGYTLIENSNLPVYLFMSVIVAFFVGLTVSAEEIIKDRKIQKRESFLNLSWSSYLSSKMITLLCLSAFQSFAFVLIGNSILEIKGMLFEYWIVLFSTWFSANMLGLLISDSFKTVVTIYILIPFLVIPQIILSGIIVKYEKLNPVVSNPNSIPAYGQIIVARWAYEALATNQYINNEYQKPFYYLDEAMSISDYKRNYWLTTLQNKVAICERNLNNTTRVDDVKNALRLIQNELNNEANSITGSQYPFKHIDKLNINDLNSTVIANLNTYLEQLRLYYIKLYNKASNKKDSIIISRQETPEEKEEFLQLKREYFNETLSDFVRNSTEIERIIEYKERLIQKIDPIYLLPETSFINAHFYAPEKSLFGHFFATIWVNTLVIWLFSILLYVALYFRLLKRFLDWLENINTNKERD